MRVLLVFLLQIGKLFFLKQKLATEVSVIVLNTSNTMAERIDLDPDLVLCDRLSFLRDYTLQTLKRFHCDVALELLKPCINVI